MPPKDAHILLPGTSEFFLHGNSDFAGIVNVKDLEKVRVVWIIQVEPIYSHESLKAENHSQLQKTRESELNPSCWF